MHLGFFAMFYTQGLVQSSELLRSKLLLLCRLEEAAAHCREAVTAQSYGDVSTGVKDGEHDSPSKVFASLSGLPTNRGPQHRCNKVSYRCLMISLCVCNNVQDM